jgi:hypothetical protein
MPRSRDPDINTDHRLRRQRVGNSFGSCCGAPRDCLLIEKVRFALDSPLEREGFEPSVPRQKDLCEPEHPVKGQSTVEISHSNSDVIDSLDCDALGHHDLRA